MGCSFYQDIPETGGFIMSLTKDLIVSRLNTNLIIWFAFALNLEIVESFFSSLTLKSFFLLINRRGLIIPNQTFIKRIESEKSPFIGTNQKLTVSSLIQNPLRGKQREKLHLYFALWAISRNQNRCHSTPLCRNPSGRCDTDIVK